MFVSRKIFPLLFFETFSDRGPREGELGFASVGRPIVFIYLFYFIFNTRKKSSLWNPIKSAKGGRSSSCIAAPAIRTIELLLKLTHKHHTPRSISKVLAKSIFEPAKNHRK